MPFSGNPAKFYCCIILLLYVLTLCNLHLSTRCPVQVREAYTKWWTVKVASSDFLSKYFGEKSYAIHTASVSGPLYYFSDVSASKWVTLKSVISFLLQTAVVGSTNKNSLPNDNGKSEFNVHVACMSVLSNTSLSFFYSRRSRHTQLVSISWLYWQRSWWSIGEEGQHRFQRHLVGIRWPRSCLQWRQYGGRGCCRGREWAITAYFFTTTVVLLTILCINLLPSPC